MQRTRKGRENFGKNFASSVGLEETEKKKLLYLLSSNRIEIYDRNALITRLKIIFKNTAITENENSTSDRRVYSGGKASRTGLLKLNQLKPKLASK